MNFNAFDDNASWVYQCPAPWMLLPEDPEAGAVPMDPLKFRELVTNGYKTGDFKCTATDENLDSSSLPFDVQPCNFVACQSGETASQPHLVPTRYFTVRFPVRIKFSTMTQIWDEICKKAVKDMGNNGGHLTNLPILGYDVGYAERFSDVYFEEARIRNIALERENKKKSVVSND